MGRLLLLAALVMSAAPAAARESPATRDADDAWHAWTGHIVPPYPSGWSEHSASCIGSANDAGGPCHHSITVIQDAQSGLRMILGLKAMNHFGREPLWRIVAVLEPDAMSDRGFDVALGTCQLRGKDDGAVVAIVRYEDRAWLAVQEAWRLGPPSGRFVPLPSADVRCANEGYGE